MFRKYAKEIRNLLVVVILTLGTFAILRPPHSVPLATRIPVGSELGRPTSFGKEDRDTLKRIESSSSEIAKTLKDTQKKLDDATEELSKHVSKSDSKTLVLSIAATVLGMLSVLLAYDEEKPYLHVFNGISYVIVLILQISL